jgi:hypothetical protein
MNFIGTYIIADAAFGHKKEEQDSNYSGDFILHGVNGVLGFKRGITPGIGRR